MFNEALLGRQAWCLAQIPESLCPSDEAKVLSKFMFFGFFFAARKQLFLERYLGDKALLKEGLLWRLGDGTSNHVWKDPWVNNDGNRFLIREPIDGVEWVSDLMDG